MLTTTESLAEFSPHWVPHFMELEHGADSTPDNESQSLKNVYAASNANVQGYPTDSLMNASAARPALTGSRYPFYSMQDQVALQPQSTCDYFDDEEYYPSPTLSIDEPRGHPAHVARPVHRTFQDYTWASRPGPVYPGSKQHVPGSSGHGESYRPLLHQPGSDALRSLQNPVTLVPPMAPLSDLMELERAREALQLATALDDLDINNPKQYSIPPPGYICKLCLVKGHWLKNCAMYKERRRENIRTFGPLAIKPHLATRLIATQHLNLPVRASLPPEGYTCRKCQVPGHWIQQCPLPKHNPPPETYICKICMIKGHWIYQCPQRIPKHQLYSY